MSSHPNDRSDLPDAHTERIEPPEIAETAPGEPVSAGPEQAQDSAPETAPTTESTTEPAQPEEPSPAPTDSDAEGGEKPGRRRRILIGSQRDAAAYRPKPKRDSIPIVGLKRRPRPKADKDQPQAEPETAAPAATSALEERPPTDAPESPEEAVAAGDTAEPTPPSDVQLQPPAAHTPPTVAADTPPTAAGETASEEVIAAEAEIEQAAPTEPLEGKRFPPPNIRHGLPPDLEEEFQAALGDAPLEELITGGDEVTSQPVLDPDSQHLGRVVMVRRDDVFVELGGREQGILPLKQFVEPPEVGAEVKVRVLRFNPEEGLYELTRPGVAADISDWAALEEGMVVEARVTGHNSGGLECEVSRLRGFIPISQISLYRVENLAELVDEKLTCLVTECNPEQRNLVLSRRAVLEREREEARRNLLESLEPGQIREGVVRKLVDFGAFVDLGGLDGLLHISQLAWGRVNHPREVLHEGQTVKVRIQEVDKAARRISLAYRDMLDNPWKDVELKYPVNSAARGKVTRIMDYGAFVELEPGVEGLVHISELSHKRVWRVSEVVKEDDEVDVIVLSADAEAQRISLSMKDLTAEPKPAEAAEKEEPSQPKKAAPPPKSPKKPSKPLAGGLGRSPGGGKFGLKW